MESLVKWFSWTGVSFEKFRANERRQGLLWGVLRLLLLVVYKQSLAAYFVGLLEKILGLL